MAKPGDFGLLEGSGPVDRLIKLGERLNGDGFSIYSHAFIVMDDQGTIVEAEPGGARIANVSEYTDTITYSSWDLNDSQRTLIVAHASAFIGVPYSAADYFAIAAHHFHLPVPGLKKFIQDDGHVICSQLVDRVYALSGIQLFQDGRWDGYVTPQDLSKVLTGPLK